MHPIAGQIQALEVAVAQQVETHHDSNDQQKLEEAVSAEDSAVHALSLLSSSAKTATCKAKRTTLM